MPHSALTLAPGVDVIKTPALNEASISSSNLIRYLADKPGQAYPQRLGGWVKYGSTFSAPIKSLKAWEDLNSNTWLAAGTTSGVFALRNTSSYPVAVSPTTATTNNPVNISATAGSNIFTVNDTGSSVNVYSSAYFTIPVSVGGAILQNIYPINSAPSTSQYTIVDNTNAIFSTAQTATITNAFPAVITVATTPPSGTVVKFTTTGTLPSPITAGTTYFVSKIDATTFSISLTPGGTFINTTTAGSGVHTANFAGQVPYYTTLSGSPVITVLLPNHNYAIGDTFAVTTATTLGGITLSGGYTIAPGYAYDSNYFTIIAATTASSTASVFQNSGNERITYYYSSSPAFPATAFGANGYGLNAYGGTASTSSGGSTIASSDWFLDNWGATLIMCPPGNPIFGWIPDSYITTGFYIQNAPVVNQGVFVAMPQQQLVTWGTSFNSIADPLLLRWSDVSDYNVWTASSVNQAGSFRIPSGSKIISCIQGPQQGLIWTDLDLWAMQYIGPPLVYGFNKIGANCGLIAPKAATQLNNITYWMAQKQFFMLSNTGPQIIPCPIWDVVFQNMNPAYTDNIRAASNSAFNEIWWFYTSANSTTNDSYVKYNTLLQVWDYGNLGRTAWIDQSVLGPPIGSGADNNLYQHEVGNSAAGGAMNVNFTTGYFQVAEGDQQVFIDQIWPDMKWNTYSNSAANATVYFTINSVNYPGDTPISYGPYAINQSTQYLSIRVRGRLFSFTIGSKDANGVNIGGEQFWRLGKIRYRFAPDGKY